MHLVALLSGVIACAAIIVLGVRFVLQPRQATLDFGIAADNLRGLTEIKGARDITSGVVPLVVWASAGTRTLGWVLVAAAITPTADAVIVLTNGGKLSKALGVHGFTAGLLVAAGLVLALG
jgi:hypothetical protein